MYKYLRVFILLLIFASVAQTTWLARERAKSWDKPLYVGIYPIAADDSATTLKYVSSLHNKSFSDIDRFFADETQRYGLNVHRPVITQLALPLSERPPAPPRAASTISAVLWSLQMRWWAWRHDDIPGMPTPTVRMFVNFYDPARTQRLAHSTGLENGMIAVVNAFASDKMHDANAVIISHELLHTLGARDKYDLQSNLPSYPDGYAEPDRQPLLPQNFAELMGGRIPISETEAKIPQSLNQVLIGTLTAQEIGWH